VSFTTPFDTAQLYPAETEREQEVQRAVTACFLKLYCNQVVQQEGDQALHFILAAANFEGTPTYGVDGLRIQLPLGYTLTEDHMYSLLNLVLVKRPFTIRALNENGLSPLAAACLMDAPDYIIEFLLRSHPVGLLEI